MQVSVQKLQYFALFRFMYLAALFMLGFISDNLISIGYIFFIYKLFLLHAMKSYRESGSISPLMLQFGVNGVEYLASRLGRFTPRKKIPCEQWLIFWVGSSGILDVLEKRKCLTPSGIQYPARPARGLDTLSITGLQTIKWTNWNTVAANSGIFSCFTFENMHLSSEYKNPLPITRQGQLGQKCFWFSKRINLL